MAALSERRGREETILSALGSFAVVHKRFCHSAYTSQDQVICGAKADQSVSGELIKESPQVYVLMRQVCLGFGHSVSLSLLVFQCSVLETKLEQILMAHAEGYYNGY